MTNPVAREMRVVDGDDVIIYTYSRRVPITDFISQQP